MLIHTLILAMSVYTNALSAEPIDRKPLDPPPESSEQSFTILDPTITLEITRSGASALTTIRSALYFETKRGQMVLVTPAEPVLEQLLQQFPKVTKISKTRESLIIFFEQAERDDLQQDLRMIGVQMLSSDS